MYNFMIIINKNMQYNCVCVCVCDAQIPLGIKTVWKDFTGYLALSETLTCTYNIL